MSDVEFCRTRMGHTFYNHNVPALIKQLTRLNDLLERLVVIEEREDQRSDDADA